MGLSSYSGDPVTHLTRAWVAHQERKKEKEGLLTVTVDNVFIDLTVRPKIPKFNFYKKFNFL